MIKTLKTTHYLVISLLGGAAISAVLSAVAPGGFSMSGFFGTGVLAWIVLFILLLAWRWGGAGRQLAWMMSLAFLLRIVLGVGLSLALPVFGNDSPTHNAGYIFLDAYQRDLQAWDLAQSGGSVLRAFGDEFSEDQYGGMLATSAGIYRIFSPSVHRPWLILLVTAGFASLGLPFFRRALSGVFDARVASAAAWIFALYPESILLGASQMRDPILISLSAIALWGALSIRAKPKIGLAVMIAALLVMAAFSWLVAAPVLAVLLVMIWVREQDHFSTQTRRLVWVGIGLAGLLGMVAITAWLRESALWDAYLSEQGSGWLQALFKDRPRWFKLVFLLFYGLTQPVLPAAIFDPALPISNSISIFRSLGWYLLLPLILYFPFALRREPASEKKGLLILSYAVVILWTVISSLRAGGDLWDNPRYRTFFIAWLALVAAWGWLTARDSRDPWLARWIAVEAVFLVVFSIFYANRVFDWGMRIPFLVWLGFVGLLGGIILIGGALFDRMKLAKAKAKPAGH